jgi:hypothetical protein
MRAILDDAQLPIEFWDEAVENDTHIRNRLPTGPRVNRKITCPEQAYTRERPHIDNIRVWGSKCYSYINPKTLPAKGRHDKLMHRGRVRVFMGYSDTTDKQYKFYAPDLGYTQRSSVLYVEEKVKGGSIDLCIRNNPSGT